MTSGAAPRILYIDDDDALRRLVSRALGRHGYDVASAASGAEGVAMAAGGGFDLVAVDHYMPAWTVWRRWPRSPHCPRHPRRLRHRIG